MSKLIDHAIQFGATVQPDGSILVPAERLTEFLTSAHATATTVPYIECRFISGRWTRPSMMLSALPDDFADHAAFLAFAAEVSSRAIAEANADGSAAFFEVGP